MAKTLEVSDASLGDSRDRLRDENVDGSTRGSVESAFNAREAESDGVLEGVRHTRGDRLRTRSRSGVPARVRKNSNAESRSDAEGRREIGRNVRVRRVRSRTRERGGGSSRIRRAVSRITLNETAVESDESQVTQVNVSNENAEHIDADFLCPICYELLHRPVTMDCGHTCCEYCLAVWLERDSSPSAWFRCPAACNQKLPRCFPSINMVLHKSVERQYPQQSGARRQDFDLSKSALVESCRSSMLNRSSVIDAINRREGFLSRLGNLFQRGLREDAEMEPLPWPFAQVLPLANHALQINRNMEGLPAPRSGIAVLYWFILICLVVSVKVCPYSWRISSVPDFREYVIGSFLLSDEKWQIAFETLYKAPQRPDENWKLRFQEEICQTSHVNVDLAFYAEAVCGCDNPGAGRGKISCKICTRLSEPLQVLLENNRTLRARTIRGSLIPICEFGFPPELPGMRSFIMHSRGKRIADLRFWVENCIPVASDKCNSNRLVSTRLLHKASTHAIRSFRSFLKRNATDDIWFSKRHNSILMYILPLTNPLASACIYTWWTWWKVTQRSLILPTFFSFVHSVPSLVWLFLAASPRLFCCWIALHWADSDPGLVATFVVFQIVIDQFEFWKLGQALYQLRVVAFMNYNFVKYVFSAVDFGLVSLVGIFLWPIIPWAVVDLLLFLCSTGVFISVMGVAMNFLALPTMQAEAPNDEVAAAAGFPHGRSKLWSLARIILRGGLVAAFVSVFFDISFSSLPYIFDIDVVCLFIVFIFGDDLWTERNATLWNRVLMRTEFISMCVLIAKYLPHTSNHFPFICVVLLSDTHLRTSRVLAGRFLSFLLTEAIFLYNYGHHGDPHLNKNMGNRTSLIPPGVTFREAHDGDVWYFTYLILLGYMFRVVAYFTVVSLVEQDRGGEPEGER